MNSEGKTGKEEEELHQVEGRLDQPGGERLPQLCPPALLTLGSWPCTVSAIKLLQLEPERAPRPGLSLFVQERARNPNKTHQNPAGPTLMLPLVC